MKIQLLLIMLAIAILCSGCGPSAQEELAQKQLEDRLIEQAQREKQAKFSQNTQWTQLGAPAAQDGLDNQNSTAKKEDKAKKH